jgi:uncharacterized protein YjbJ (UPF0337 family)
MRERIEGDWSRLRHRARHEWARLTDEHLDEIDGRRDRLRNRIRDVYGVSDDEADKQVTSWERSLALAERGDPEPDWVPDTGTPRTGTGGVFENEGREFGEHDRPGGAGMPGNQGGGRDPGPVPPNR